MGWESEFGASHEGRAVAVLADGSEPGPVYFDMNSGGCAQSSTNWWVYDGEGRRPRATHVQGGCSCGWRGAPLHAIEWTRDDDGPAPVLDELDPREDWKEHLCEVRVRTVPVPSGLEELLRQVDGTMTDLACEDPLATLRALAVLERLVADIGRTASFNARADKTSEEIATALGMTSDKASSLLRGYLHSRRRHPVPLRALSSTPVRQRPLLRPPH
ncbi:hypothetical protein AB0H73_38710 [Streptomyces olivoreticuli]